MKIFRFLTLTAILSSIFSTTAFAATGIGRVGTLLGDIVGGILNGISDNPAVWMKVILIVILYVILYAVFQKISFPHNKGGRIILGLAISIGSIAAVPNIFITALFTSFQFLGIIIYILPVIGIYYLVRSLAHGVTDKGPHWIAATIWLATLTIYVQGFADILVTAGISNPEGVETTAGFMSLIVLGFMIYHIFKALEGTKISGGVAETLRKRSPMAQGVERAAFGFPTKQDVVRMEGEVQTAIDSLKSLTGIAQTLPKGAKGANIRYLKDNQNAIINILNSIRNRIENLEKDKGLKSIIQKKLGKDFSVLKQEIDKLLMKDYAALADNNALAKANMEFKAVFEKKGLAETFLNLLKKEIEKANV